MDNRNSADSQLLERLAGRQDEDAFNELFRRYYRLVWSVCQRRLLGHEHLAEDAVQAVFLVLLRQVRRIRNGCALSVWLYQTARRASSTILRAENRRRAREIKVADMKTTAARDPAPEACWNEIRCHLDEAIGRLPGKQRDAVVMHYIAGKSLGEISIQTGVARATIQTRLETALEKLRTMLSARNVAVSTGTLGVLIADNSLEAAPAGLEKAILAGIARCTSADGSAVGGMANMVTGEMIFVAKLKAAAMIIAAVLLLGGAATGTYVAVSGGPETPAPPVPAPIVITPSVAMPASDPSPPPAMPAETRADVDIIVDCGRTHQVIRGFGTCMKSWDSPEKDPAAKWQIDPRGLELYVKDGGFAVARIPLVPQVLEGENPGKMPTTLTVGMMEDPAKITFDTFRWEFPGTADEKGLIPRGIRWCQELRKLNSDMLFIASVWSPPHWMKEQASTGPGVQFELKGANSCGGRLAPKYYRHFAHYLAQWCLAMEKKFNVPLYAVSIQNEPWFVQNFVSCIYTPQEYHAAVAEVAAVFRQLGVRTKIMGPEDVTKFPQRLWEHVKPILADPMTKDALEIIASHGYSDSIEPGRQSGDCAALRELMKDSDREYWMTQTPGGPADWQTKEGAARRDEKGLATNALDCLGSSIHNAIVTGNASIWCTWQFLETAGNTNDESNGLAQASMTEIRPTKKYYIQKHYSAFIPPGARRVETGKDSGGVLAGAFADAGKGVLTLVLQNHNTAETSVRIKVSGGLADSSLAAYVTDKDRNCKKSADVPVKSGTIEVKMPPRCIMTLTTKPQTQ